MLEEMANNVEEATQEQKKPTVVPQDHKKSRLPQNNLGRILCLSQFARR